MYLEELIKTRKKITYVLHETEWLEKYIFSQILQVRILVKFWPIFIFPNMKKAKAGFYHNLEK